VVAIAAYCDVMLIVAGAFGLAALLNAQPMLLNVALWGGAAFLVCYALFALRRALDFRSSLAAADTSVGSRAAFAAGASAISILWFAGLGYGAGLLAPIFAKLIAWRIVDFTVAAIMGTVAVSLVRVALDA